MLKLGSGLTGFAALLGLWPRAARASMNISGEMALGNDQLKLLWQGREDGLKYPSITHLPTGFAFTYPRGMRLELEDDRSIRLRDCSLIGEPVLAGGGMQTRWQSRDGRVIFEISTRLDSEAHYVTQRIRVISTETLLIRRIICFEDVLDSVHESGPVRGCPLIFSNGFLAIAHPLAEHRVRHGKMIGWMPRELPLPADQPLDCELVMGFGAPGQVRRTFQSYLEAVRPRRYQPFLHYNSWYDLGFSDIQYNEADMLSRINAFAAQKIPLLSYLLDDGWDDPKTLWQFHGGFPNGLSPIAEKARMHDAAPGIWLSPWGGYGNEKQARMATAQSMGFETNADGLALSGPKYYAYFRDRCLSLIRESGVNQFKLDGLGSANHVAENSAFDSDFDAAIHLIETLRKAKPDLYVNLTYGTYASPFWLRYADSIWRGGKDHDFIGEGTKRQQWITYRDADTYEGVVLACPLFPLNSLMLHGIIFAQHTKHLKSDPFGDFEAEVHSFFASGTQCQELYISPDLLQERHWQILRHGMEWFRRFQAILADNHWVGGNPLDAEIYGWAGWHPQQGGMLSLRNPSTQSQSFAFEPVALFELPVDATADYRMQNSWGDASDSETIHATQSQILTLEPFEVRSVYFEPITAQTAQPPANQP